MFWRGLALPGSAWLVVLFVVPLALLAAVAVTNTDLVGRPIWGTFSLDGFTELANPIYVPVIVRTFTYSLVVSAICLVLGYCVAFAISRYGGRAKTLLVLMVLLPWLIDYLIRIYSWIQVLGSGGMLAKVLSAAGLADDSFSLLSTHVAVIVGLVYGVLPFMILPIYVAIEAQDPRLVEACQDLYGSPWHAFLHVTVPASISGVISGVTIVFLLTFGDFANARLLGGPDQYMLGNLVQDQFAGIGARSFAAAITVCVLIVILLVLGVFTRVSRIAERKFT
jgi:spermidine/putrescine transport system permease protein